MVKSEAVKQRAGSMANDHLWPAARARPHDRAELFQQPAPNLVSAPNPLVRRECASLRFRADGQQSWEKPVIRRAKPPERQVSLQSARPRFDELIGQRAVASHDLDHFSFFIPIKGGFDNAPHFCAFIISRSSREVRPYDHRETPLSSLSPNTPAGGVRPLPMRRAAIKCTARRPPPWRGRSASTPRRRRGRPPNCPCPPPSKNGPSGWSKGISRASPACPRP